MTRLLLLVLVAALTVVAAPAHAHNVLRSSDPADGASVPAPSQIALTFDQSVQALGTLVEVEGPRGPLDLGPLEVEGQSVVQPLSGGVPAGDYTVLWRATSADGHPIEGRLTFTATTAANPPASTTSAPPPAPSLTATPTGIPPTSASLPPASTPASTATTADAGTDDPAGSSLPLWLAIGMAVLAVLAVVAGGALLVRRRGDR